MTHKKQRNLYLFNKIKKMKTKNTKDNKKKVFGRER